MRRFHVAGAAILAGVFVLGPAALSSPPPLYFEEFRVSAEAMAATAAEWSEALAISPPGTWAPLRMELSDAQLARMGLPSKKVLLARRYPEPTMVFPNGKTERVSLSSIAPTTTPMGPTVATYAGAGWFGIRPGAWLLLLNGNTVGWCSMAHVFGSPGSYRISTAGHCGKTGDTATVIAAFGNRAGIGGPILLDFGKFSSSTDGGVGNDWALISVDSAWQSLVTPTMAFWGGPRGIYTKTGSTVALTFPGNGTVPTVGVDTDPLLAQAIVHYGHGVGIGIGGTPRVGTAIHWATSHFVFFGAVSPGDSGSGANTLGGDTLAATMEAAGIITHLYIDPLMRKGLGIMAGTRSTRVNATLANGQIVPYPVPAAGLP